MSCAAKGADLPATLKGHSRTLGHEHRVPDLQSAFGRRAIIEPAKGILMARNDIDADAAFALLKSHSQPTGQKLIEVAAAVAQTHRLLPAAPLGNKGERQ